MKLEDLRQLLSKSKPPEPPKEKVLNECICSRPRKGPSGSMIFPSARLGPHHDTKCVMRRDEYECTCARSQITGRHHARCFRERMNQAELEAEEQDMVCTCAIPPERIGNRIDGDLYSGPHHDDEDCPLYRPFYECTCAVGEAGGVEGSIHEADCFRFTVT